MPGKAVELIQLIAPMLHRNMLHYEPQQNREPTVPKHLLMLQKGPQHKVQRPSRLKQYQYLT